MKNIKSFIKLFCIAFFMLLLQNQHISAQIPAPTKFYTNIFHINNSGNANYWNQAYNTSNSYGYNVGAEGVHNNETNQHWLVLPTYPGSDQYFIVNYYNGGILDIDVAHNNNVYVYTPGLPHCRDNQIFKIANVDGLGKIGTPYNPAWVIGRSTSGETKDPWDWPNRRTNNLYIQTTGENYMFNSVGTIPNSDKIAVFDNKSVPPMPTLGTQKEDYNIISEGYKLPELLVAQTVIPYPLVKDNGLTQAQKAANSPYYILKKYRYYEVGAIVSLTGDFGLTEPVEISYESSVTHSSEVENTLSTKFSVGGKVSSSATIEDILTISRKITTNFEKTISLKTTSAVITSDEQTAKYLMTLTKDTRDDINVAFYTLFEHFALYRLNGTKPFLEWEVPVDGSIIGIGTEVPEVLGHLKLADGIYRYNIHFSYFTSNASTIDAVPVMTSNTSPSGIASASSVYSSSYEAWRAFDGNDVSGTASRWISSSTDLTPCLTYEFAKPEVISAYYLAPETGGTGDRAPKSWKLQGWNGNNWYTIDEQSNIRVGIEWNPAGNTFPIKRQRYYSKYRLLVNESNGSPIISIKQFKLYYPQTVIPTMTSNTAPSGIASASGIYGSSYDSWKALDGKNNLLTTRWISETRSSKTGWWLAYDFGATTSITGYFIYPEVFGGRAPLSWYLQGWNGSQWITIDQQSGMTTTEWGKTNGKLFKLANAVSYSKYRVLFNAANGSDVVSIYSFELYGNGTALKSTEEGITNESDGIQNTKKITDISVYPNPSNGNFTINVVGDVNQGIPVSISDFSGKVVYSTVLNDGQTQINAKLPVGVYILKSEIDGKLKSQKIIIR